MLLIISNRWIPINLFEKKGVKTKTEDDDHIFPASNRSQTIIDCPKQSILKLGISIQLNQLVSDIVRKNVNWKLHLSSGNTAIADRALIAIGSLKESNILNQLRELSHTIHPLIPSHLHSIYPIIMHDLSGLSVKNVSL